MIVFDLRCAGGHVFEAWFGSSADYDDQRARNLVACPLCGDASAENALMAPNVAAKGNRTGDAAPAEVKAALTALAAAQEKALEAPDWAESSFADRDRELHAGKEAHATLHGPATSIENPTEAAEDVRTTKTTGAHE